MGCDRHQKLLSNIPCYVIFDFLWPKRLEKKTMYGRTCRTPLWRYTTGGETRIEIKYYHFGNMAVCMFCIERKPCSAPVQYVSSVSHLDDITSSQIYQHMHRCIGSGRMMYGSSWVTMVTLLVPAGLLFSENRCWAAGLWRWLWPVQLPADCLSKPCSNIRKVSAPHTGQVCCLLKALKGLSPTNFLSCL